MTKRTGPIGSAKPTSPAAATAPAAAAPAAEAPLSQEKTPEEKAAIAAVAQAPVGAAEPFAAAAPEDVAKNVVADAMVAAAAAAGDPLALKAGGEPQPGAPTAPIGATLDDADRVLGAPDVADQLGGPIPRAPGVAAAAAALDPFANSVLEFPTEQLGGRAEAWMGAIRQSDAGFVSIDDLAGRTFMVRSASDRGRRRGGISFGPTAIPVDVDDLTPENLGLILSDKQLFAELLPREY